MKQNHYESVVIINAALEDEQVNSIITKIEDHLKSNNSEITDIDKWGRKRLAYPIQKSKSGFYVIFRFITETSVIKGLERMYRLDENIIRYLTIVLDSKAVEHIVAAKEKEEAEASEAEVSESVAVEEPKEENNEENSSEEESKESEE